MPIDCPRNKHKVNAKIVAMDLTSPHAAKILDTLVDDFNVVAVHFGLPCGTCSKARGIPLEDGSAGPPPLPSFDFLHGLPDLTEPWIKQRCQRQIHCIHGLINSYRDSKLVISSGRWKTLAILGFGSCRS